MEPINPYDPVDIMVEIKKGMSGREISELLGKKGVIKSSTLFYLLLRLKEVDNLKAGYYRFSTSATPLAIIEKIKKGEEERFSITIPEGFTLNQILNRFAAVEMPKLEAEKLNNFLDKYVLELELERDLNQLREDQQELSFAEGFIVPETYNFPVSYSEQQLAKSLINHFAEERLSLLKAGAAESKFSAFELLIIASLIEKEGKLPSEHELIASVIYNRLEAGMPLQLDATIQYVLQERTERVLYSDLEIKSPYNTYLISALPPTPIASPGTQAVEAAINPAETDYFFYFATADGSHIFTKTYTEHLRKQQEVDNSR
jgi:UPF0755 protein